MGRIYKPVKVHWNGSVDGLIGYSRYGADYFRMHANHVTNPNTEAQQDKRALFGALSKAVSLLDPAYKIGLKQFITDGQGPRAIASILNRPAISGNRTAQTIDYASLIISKGSTPLPYNIIGNVNSGSREITISWTDNTGIYGAKGTDIIGFLLVNTSKQEKIFVNTASRADETIDINYPAGWTGDTLHLYAMAYNAEGIASDTKHEGPYTA